LTGIKLPQNSIKISAQTHEIRECHFDLLIMPDEERAANRVVVLAGVRPSDESSASADSMSYTLATFNSGSPIKGGVTA